MKHKIFFAFLYIYLPCATIARGSQDALNRNASVCNGNTGYNSRDVGPAKTVSKKALSAYGQHSQA